MLHGGGGGLAQLGIALRGSTRRAGTHDKSAVFKKNSVLFSPARSFRYSFSVTTGRVIHSILQIGEDYFFSPSAAGPDGIDIFLPLRCCGGVIENIRVLGHLVLYTGFFFFFLSLGPWPSPLSGFLWIREYLYSLLVDTNFP